MRVVKRGARTMPKEGGVLATWFLVCFLGIVIVISVSWVPCSFPMPNRSHISHHFHPLSTSFLPVPSYLPSSCSHPTYPPLNSREQGNRSQLTNSSMYDLQQCQRLRPLCKLPNTGENISRPMHPSNQQHSSQNSAPEDGRNGIVEDQIASFERGRFAFGRRAGGLLGSVGHGWRCGIGVGVVFWRRERESNTFESLGASGDLDLDPGEGAPG